MLISYCKKKREGKIKKELADSTSDFGYLRLPKILSETKKTRREKIAKI